MKLNIYKVLPLAAAAIISTGMMASNPVSAASNSPFNQPNAQTWQKNQNNDFQKRQAQQEKQRIEQQKKQQQLEKQRIEQQKKQQQLEKERQQRLEKQHQDTLWKQKAEDQRRRDQQKKNNNSWNSIWNNSGRPADSDK